MDKSDEKLIDDLLRRYMEESNGHIYQWSKFSPDRSEQYVIRHNDETEFDRLVLKYKSVIPQANVFPDDVGHVATPQSKIQEGVPMCGVHGTPMKWITGKYKNTTEWHTAGDDFAFWSCGQKNADNSYCNYKVPKKKV